MDCVGDVVEVLEVGGEGVAGVADELDHETAAPVDGGADSGFAGESGAIHIGLAGEVGGATLRVTEFDGAGLGVEFALDDFSKFVSGAREDWMAEGVQAAFVGAQFVAGGISQTFTNDDHAEFVSIDGRFDFVQESRFVEGDFRNQNDVRGVVRAPFGENGGSGEPASGAAHHFDNAAGAFVGGHAANVQADFHYGGGDVFSGGRKAGAEIGVREIVV